MAAEMPKQTEGRGRLIGTLGWVAGGCLGLVLNGVLLWWFGEQYPVGPTTFALFVAGAFGGMKVADKFGERAFAPLAIATGVLFALFVSGLTVLLFRAP